MAKELWIDDLRPPRYSDMIWAKTVTEAKRLLLEAEESGAPFNVVDIDNDAGDFACYGGDYYRVLDWMEEVRYTQGGFKNVRIVIHSMNPCGVERMLETANSAGWSATVLRPTPTKERMDS